MKFKRKSRNNTQNYVTQNSAAKKKDEKDWYAEQYEKLIGKPLPRKELTTEEVIKKLKDATKYRWIPEAKTYKGSVPEIGPAHYFEWNKPDVNKCTCLDSECTCKGDLMFPRKRIPSGKRYFKSPILQKIMMKFTKSDKTPSSTPNFTQRLADLIEIEAEHYKDLEKRGDLGLRGAEFCFSRCIRFYGPARLQESKYVTDEQNPRVEELKPPELKENDDGGDRKHDGLEYTVSTLPTAAPCPEFGFGMVFQEVYEPNDAILKDINGTRLHISSIQCSGDEPNNVLLKGYDKLFSFGERLNMKELRNKFHLLKQNIYSSIIDIKDNRPTLQSMSTQYDDNVPSDKLAGNKSSEGITIATPYKGVTVKVKKKPTNSEQKDNSQIENMNTFDLSEKIHSAKISKDDSDVTHKISIKDMLTKSIMMEKLEMKESMTTILKRQEIFEKSTADQKMELIDSIVNPDKNKESLNKAELNKCSTHNSVFDIQTEVILKETLNVISNSQMNTNKKRDKKMPTDVINAEHTKHSLKSKYYGFSLDQLHSSKIKRFIKFLRNEKLLSSPDETSVKETGSDDKVTKLMINSVKEISNKQSFKEKLSLPQTDSNLNSQFQLDSDSDKLNLKTKRIYGIEKQRTIDEHKVVSSRNLLNTTSIINDSTNVKQAKEDSEQLQIQSECYVSTHNVTSSSDKSTDLPSEPDNIIKIKENKRSDESKIIDFEISFNSKCNNETFSKMLKDKIDQSVLDYQNTENLCVNKNIESQKQESLTKTLLKLSSLLKRALPERKNNLIKSLPEPQCRHCKSDQVDANCGANKIDFKEYQYNKEAKSSEKEMFSIQYYDRAVGQNESSKKSLQIST